MALARELDFSRPTSLDLRIRRAMQTRQMRKLRESMAPLYPLGLPGVFVPAAYLIARRLRRRRLAGGSAIVASAWLGWLAHRAIKLAYARVRPTRRGVARRTDSYPSGHTTGVTAVAVTIAHVLERDGLLSRRDARLLAIGAPAVMGAYRVIDDEHWTTDVVGGWLFGAAIAYACTALATGSPAGSHRLKREPLPGVLSTVISPRIM